MEFPETGAKAQRVTHGREAQLSGQEWWQADGGRREKMLAELWGDRGISTAEISRRIGDGCTKNKVISKAHRLGLPARYEKPTPPPKVNPITQLGERSCRWPIGHPREDDFHFCGDPETVVGKPYCERHAAVAYIRPGPQRK